MSPNSFRTELNAQPFRAFLVKTTDGDTFKVEHPDYALVSEDGSEVKIHESDQHYRRVAMAHVVSIEPAREQARKPGKR